MVTRKFMWLWIVVAILQHTSHAGPMERSSRLVREVYPEIEPENEGNQAQVCIVGDVVYGVEEAVPAEQPCLKCRCQPPGVQCETIKCAKKPGCKAIHKPNKCCPDYQCECHHEGRVYANGERLKTPPGGECKVCYCRGGEVQCAEVSCYIRNDCEGKTVPGQCCPKYDHCPPKEPLLGRPTFTTDLSLPKINRQVLELWPISKLLQNASEESTDANRIEGDKETVTESIGVTRTAVENFTDDNLKQVEQPRITIQEIIPEIKEIPITAPSKLEIEERKDLDANNDLVVTDSEPDSSEISEVFQQPPPVLRIGDKLLFLKQGELVPENGASTPTSVITIIGAEGLQRGFEDSAEFHEIKSEDHLLFNNSNDLEPKTSESTHILSLVKKKPPKDVVTTTTEITPIESTTVEEIFEKVETTTINNDNSNTAEITSELITTPEPQTSTTEAEEITNKTTLLSVESSTRANDEIEQNPAYPSLPDVMSPQNAEKPKILLEVLEIRSNKTIPKNQTHGEWLKNDNSGESLVNVRALLPDDILTLKAASDDAEDSIETTTQASEIEATTIEDDNVTTTDRSIESMEVIEDSGEATTPKDNHASLLSTEDASIESSSINPETLDMLRDVSTNPSSRIDDVETIYNQTDNVETTTQPMSKDVEMINIDKEPAVVIKDEKIQEMPRRSIGKRENSLQDEADEVFRQLEEEITADSTERILTEQEDKVESDQIFKELLEETSTPKSTKKLDKDSETLQRVSDAIARFTLKGRQQNTLDTSILRILSDFFSSQYRSYNGGSK